MGIKKGATRKCLCPIACMNWNNSSNAGVWSVNLNNDRTDSNNNAGGRADYGFASQSSSRIQWNCRDVTSRLVRTMITPFFLVGINPTTRMEVCI